MIEKFYAEKIKIFENEILKLDERLDAANQYDLRKQVMTKEGLIKVEALDDNQYFDSITNNIIKSIVINSVKDIKVVY